MQEPPFGGNHWISLFSCVFFAVTLVFLPVALCLLFRLFQPDLTIEISPGVQQIFIQAVMDCVLVGFILLLIKELHGRPILRTLHSPDAQEHGRWTSDRGRRLPCHYSAARLFILSDALRFPLEKLLTTTPSIVDVRDLWYRGRSISRRDHLPRISLHCSDGSLGLESRRRDYSGAFRRLHLSQLRGNWPAVIVIFLVGYVLTLVRYRTDSLIPSVIMHTAYNAMIFGISAIGTVLEHSRTCPN